MLDKIKQQNPAKTIVFLVALLLFLLFWMSVNTFGQTTDKAQTSMAQNVGEKKSVPVLKPVLQNYKNVTLGMMAKEVRDALGKPEVSDDQSLYYKFSGEESAQLALNSDKKVYVISMMYMDKNNKAPKPADIFGAETEVTPNADGSIYKMVRYPEAGYVVVYSRTAGNDPMVVVTMQKI